MSRPTPRPELNSAARRCVHTFPPCRVPHNSLSRREFCDFATRLTLGRAIAQPATGAGVRYCTTCRAVYVSDFARCPNDGGALDVTDDDPLVGTDVSHYRVDEFIGGGAMGRVYRAHHTLLHHKQVALKVLRGDLAATMAMRLRFTQEAESASHLVHPNVVSVSDFGRTETGLLFIAMDFIEGRNLADIIVTEGPLSVSRTIALAQQLCAGLGHAHEQGFVHRDFQHDN